MKLNYELVGDVVTVTLHKGESRGDYKEEEIVEQVAFDAGTLAEAFDAGEAGTKTLAGYGLLKLLQDRTSQDKGSSEKFEAMGAEFDRLSEPGAMWRKPVMREGGGRTRNVDAVLAQAVANVQGISLAQASAALKGVDKEKFEAVSKNEKVVAEIEKLKGVAEEEVDLEDLL